MRIGNGYDVHRLVADRPLVLGGVGIPYEKGLLGHSDADVLTHAVCDALLGAVGLGDIGIHFPDTDDQYKGICSLELLVRCYEKVQKKGFTLVNMDAVIFAQAPKLAAYRTAMQEKIAQTMQVPTDCINIKATTTEGLGYIGTGEGIAAMCTVLIDSFRRQ